VRSDAALLERILSNLVSNAIRYTASGRVVVGCRRRGDMLRIMVLDTGSGIPAHLHDEIFEEFFQVANPERDRNKGLGLGLSIVRRTASILGHRLVMHSQPNRGSMFGIDVPLARDIPPVTDAPFSVTDRNRLQGTFVAIIDDDSENRFAIEALCAQWGCHVVGAPSGAVAIAELGRHLRSPDLVITDYRLGHDETGTAAVVRIREIVEECVPAIIITGDMSVREQDLASCGRSALLYKPINAEKLWTAAEALLSGSGVSMNPR
jgi:CheY-like chemotaxis protein